MARGKIKKPLCESYIKYVVTPNVEGDLDHSYQTYLDLNKSHVVMIANKGIIAKSVAARILEVTQEMAAMGDKPNFYVDPRLEGTYFNLEKYLIDKTGIEIGGQQHTARSRNDLIATVSRIDVRKVYLDLCEKVNLMRRTLIELADRNKETVMAGYTHLQPSEPITFAHYCSGILCGLDRDSRRLAAVFESINICPMGSGSMGSTTWDIDRQYMSDIHGFDAPIENSIDGVASRDYALELLSAIAIMSNTLSRLCADLYVWATPEFGYIEVDDSVAICSSIMPQKKNPITLEYVKGKAGNLSGMLTGALSTLRNTPYTNTCDVVGETGRYVFTAIKEMCGCCEMMTDTLKSLVTRKDRMVTNALGNFCTVTELANALVRHDKISFRAAHEIVAELVDIMIKTGKKANEIHAEDVNVAFEKLFQKKTSMTDEQILVALDPVRSAMSKKILGGTAPEEVSRQLVVHSKRLDEDMALLEKRKAKIAAAKARLEQDVNNLIASQK